jgi:ABC-type transport system involved in multi-copper enzyme maturation permease subunit
MKTLLTIPISKKSLFSSKIIVLFMWSVLLLLWNAVVTIIGSLIIHTPGVNLQNILFVFSINLRTAPIYILCVLPLVAIIVASRKNYTLSIGISIAITLCNIVVQGTGNTKLASFWPGLIVWRFNGADQSGLNIPFYYPAWISGITLIGFGIISLIITFRSLRKQNN